MYVHCTKKSAHVQKKLAFACSIFADIFGDPGDLGDPVVRLLHIPKRPYIQMELPSAVQVHNAVYVRKINTYFSLSCSICHAFN